MYSKLLLSPVIILWTLIVLILALWFHWRWKYRHYLDLANKLPGPPTIPFKGTPSMYTQSFDGKIHSKEIGRVKILLYFFTKY